MPWIWIRSRVVSDSTDYSVLSSDFRINFHNGSTLDLTLMKVFFYTNNFYLIVINNKEIISTSKCAMIRQSYSLFFQVLILFGVNYEVVCSQSNVQCYLREAQIFQWLCAPWFWPLVHQRRDTPGHNSHIGNFHCEFSTEFGDYYGQIVSGRSVSPSLFELSLIPSSTDDILLLPKFTYCKM